MEVGQKFVMRNNPDAVVEIVKVMKKTVQYRFPSGRISGGVRIANFYLMYRPQ